MLFLPGEYAIAVAEALLGPNEVDAVGHGRAPVCRDPVATVRGPGSSNVRSIEPSLPYTPEAIASAAKSELSPAHRLAASMGLTALPVPENTLR